MPPTMGGPPPENGRGKKKRKRQEGLGVGIVKAVIVGLAGAGLILASPLIFGADPWDAAHFVDAYGDGLRGTLEAKLDALRTCSWHKQEISHFKLSHDGKSVTFADKAGELSSVTVSGYDYDEAAEAESDWTEALEIPKRFKEALEIVKGERNG